MGSTPGEVSGRPFDSSVFGVRPAGPARIVLLAVLLAALVACSPEGREGAQRTGKDTEPAAHRGSTTTPEPASSAPGLRTTWDYVALGDSLAVGVGARRGYVARYAEHIRSDTGARVRVINLGVSGQTSSQLLHALRNDPSVRRALSGAEVVTFNIGINDLGRASSSYQNGACGRPRDRADRACLREAARTVERNWDSVTDEILSLRSTDDTVIRTAGLGYTPRVEKVFRPYLRVVNGHIASSAEDEGIPHTEVRLGDGEMSPDGVHPNDEGYGMIADRLRELGYEPLSSRQERSR